MSDLSQAKAISLKSKVSPAEWALRVDVAACYRLAALFGMNDPVYNHISGRVPGEDGRFGAQVRPPAADAKRHVLRRDRLPRLRRPGAGPGRAAAPGARPGDRGGIGRDASQDVFSWDPI